MSDYSIYPNALDGYSQLPLAIDLVTEIDAKSINRLRSAIINIEKELGILPSGEFSDLVSRLDDMDDQILSLNTQFNLLNIIGLSEAYKNKNSIELNPTYGDFEITGDGNIDFNVDSNINLESNNLIILKTNQKMLLESENRDVEIIGTNNMGVSVSGIRNMGVQSSTESIELLTGTYNTGDNFYHSNSNNKTLLYYDSDRLKWLSEDSIYLYFGRNGLTANGQYYRGIDGLLLSASSGIVLPFNGTIVAIGYSRSNTDESIFAVTENGTNVCTLTSTALSGYSTSLNVDVSQGNIIGMKNNGPNDTSNVSGWVKIKFRG